MVRWVPAFAGTTGKGERAALYAGRAGWVVRWVPAFAGTTGEWGRVAHHAGAADRASASRAAPLMISPLKRPSLTAPMLR